MKLAINGGKKIRTEPFPDQLNYGEEEIYAITKFLERGQLLSNYRGNWIKEFWGGPEVRKFEDAWNEKFNFNHSLAVNSCTSALQIACHAIGLMYGDEVIVTPWSMSCSATAPLVCQATPVFADIEPEQFCLDYDSVKSKITENTKAIIAVSLFGSPIDPRLYILAKEKGIYLIEDCAQAPGAYYENKTDHPIYTGNLADIACYSFTQGKHISSGEGGMISTNDYELAMKCAFIRNHSESVVSAIEGNNQSISEIMQNEPSSDIIRFKETPGYNMRMTELQAVIMQEQLKKLDCYIINKRHNAFYIRDITSNIDFIKTPNKREDVYHAYYVQPFLFDKEIAGISRETFVNAVQAELTGEKSRPDRPMMGCGYIKPLYRMPIFEFKYNSDCPLPVVEKLWKEDFFLSMYHNLPLESKDADDIINAFHKVAENIEELKTPQGKNYWRAGVK